MRRLALTLAIAATLGSGWANGADWHPAKGPLFTHWTKDVTPDNVHREYPRPQMVRKDWLSLNGLWQLAFAQKDQESPFGQNLPERILVPFPVESALSGVMKHADRLWYRRTFTIPASWKDKQVLLHFGAVDWEATVWVNGKKLGSHRGGYDDFSFDITDALKQDGEQEVIVGVWDPTSSGTQPRGKQVNNPRGIYYTPTTGIWQSVWLEPVPKAYIQSLRIVPDVDANRVIIQVNVKGNADDLALGYGVTLPNDRGKPGIGIASASPVVNKPFQVQLPEEAKSKLWSPETPYLFGLSISLQPKGNANFQPLDTVTSYFGMRKTSLGKDDKGVTRLFLNNKPYFQAGPLDQGFWPDGLYTAPTDEALKYDIEMTKRLGFNMARKHVKVEPDRWYYWCDRLGLLVWQDMPSGDQSVPVGKPDLVRSPESAKQYELELKRMIDGRYNHPCIIMWVVFNEGWGQFDTARITKWTKEYDPTRLVNCASGWNDRQVGDVHDIHSYPGPDSPAPESNRAAVLGEFGGLGLGVDGHTWAKQTWGYRGTTSSEDLTRKYQQLLRRVWELKEKRGLSAAVYTQSTDVETEANGLMTYDRAVLKVDEKRVAAANKGK
jgi:beta-galactosidase/beta-glucuronidase